MFLNMMLLAQFGFSDGVQLDIKNIYLKNYNSINLLKKENKKLIEKIEQLELQQSANLEKIKALFALAKYGKLGKTKSAIAQKEHTNAAAKKLYKDAKKLLLTSNYMQASAKFKHYLNLYPNSDFSADSRYWLAKTYLIQGKYKSASRGFMSFQKKHKAHTKYPNSLLELAKTHLKLNKKYSAKRLLKQFIEKFPMHKLNESAKKLLNNII
jgi:tol-pal system protein YbgF